MWKWRVAVMTGLGLLTLLSAAPPLETQPAQAGVCDPDGKVANLDFVLKDMGGKDVMLNAYKGKVILLDFWATWCAPCRIEIPNFVELYKKYQAQGFVVLGVSVDDPVSKLKSFAKELRMNYPVLVGLDRDDVKDAFGPPPGYPTSFIIGRDGKICSQHTGFAPKEEFERKIKALL
ncbi:MAG: TlpA family protein disulfide reductase [Acidobacteria bacterium]|nr:TlpA family protein disulfide reductase [Acidobacteriota bacterium]